MCSHGKHVVLSEWFSNRTGTSIDEGAHSKNTCKELCRQPRHVLTEMWFSKEVRRECLCPRMVYIFSFRNNKSSILIFAESFKFKFRAPQYCPLMRHQCCPEWNRSKQPTHNVTSHNAQRQVERCLCPVLAHCIQRLIGPFTGKIINVSFRPPLPWLQQIFHASSSFPANRLWVQA